MTISEKTKKQILELESEELADRQNAITKLSKRKNEALIQLLIELLDKNLSSLFKESACTILGELQSKDAIDILIKCLKVDDEGIKFKATIALGKIGDPKACQPLIEKLKKEVDPLLKSEAVVALGKIGHPCAVQPLLSALKNESDPFVKQHAIKALGQIGSDEALKSLQTFARHQVRDPSLSLLTHEAVQQIMNVNSLINNSKN